MANKAGFAERDAVDTIQDGTWRGYCGQRLLPWYKLVTSQVPSGQTRLDPYIVIQCRTVRGNASRKIRLIFDRFLKRRQQCRRSEKYCHGSESTALSHVASAYTAFRHFADIACLFRLVETEHHELAGAYPQTLRQSDPVPTRSRRAAISLPTPSVASPLQPVLTSTSE